MTSPSTEAHISACASGPRSKIQKQNSKAVFNSARHWRRVSAWSRAVIALLPPILASDRLLESPLKSAQRVKAKLMLQLLLVGPGVPCVGLEILTVEGVLQAEVQVLA